MLGQILMNSKNVFQKQCISCAVNYLIYIILNYAKIWILKNIWQPRSLGLPKKYSENNKNKSGVYLWKFISPEVWHRKKLIFSTGESIELKTEFIMKSRILIIIRSNMENALNSSP